MPEPSPALVDTIASALANATAPGATEWWETITGVHGSQHEQPQQVEDYRRMARAALDAMPKPIGYVGAWHEDIGWTLDIEPGERLRPTAAQALKDSSDYHYPINTVVAVVPVEGNPA